MLALATATELNKPGGPWVATGWLGRIPVWAGDVPSYQTTTLTTLLMQYLTSNPTKMNSPSTPMPIMSKNKRTTTICIHHALTMTMGTDWDELSIPYTDPANSEIAMDRAPDRYRYVLGGPIVMEPGKRWTYNGGATALLGRIIAKGTGKLLHDYAREVLFEPLGMGPTDWFNASGNRQC